MLDKYNENVLVKSFFLFFKLSMTIMMLAHYLSCIFNGVALLNDPYVTILFR